MVIGSVITATLLCGRSSVASFCARFSNSEENPSLAEALTLPRLP
jgi:hypothetical protein